MYLFIKNTSVFCVLTFLFFLCRIQVSLAQQDQQWAIYEGQQGPGKGKHIVLVSGDEEYRSEEALPMIAQILAEHHGFKATVLFALDPDSGEIDPENQSNIPGLEQLQSADLMVIFTRFRGLPEPQMKYIDEYVQAGKPIVGMRTATHAFKFPEDSPYAKYSFDSQQEGWEGGFGRKILGETWVDHHGAHGKEGTRALIDGIRARTEHPILQGVNDIWAATDVYGTRELTGDPEVLVWGQPTHGMTPDASVNWQKTVMPIAWTKEYTSESGNTGRVFTTTMGASVDLGSEDLRRLLVNACYWAVGMESKIPQESKVDIVGDYDPTMFGFGDHKKGKRPSDFAVK